MIKKKLIVGGILTAVSATVAAGDWNVNQETTVGGLFTINQGTTNAVSGSTQGVNTIEAGADDTVTGVDGTADQLTDLSAQDLDMNQGDVTSSTQTINSVTSDVTTLFQQTVSDAENASLSQTSSTGGNNVQAVNNVQEVAADGNSTGPTDVQQALTVNVNLDMTQNNTSAGNNVQGLNRIAVDQLSNSTQTVDVSGGNTDLNQGGDQAGDTQALNAIQPGTAVAANTHAILNVTQTANLSNTITFDQTAGGTATQVGNLLDTAGNGSGAAVDGTIGGTGAEVTQVVSVAAGSDVDFNQTNTTDGNVQGFNRASASGNVTIEGLIQRVTDAAGGVMNSTNTGNANDQAYNAIVLGDTNTVLDTSGGGEISQNVSGAQDYTLLQNGTGNNNTQAMNLIRTVGGTHNIGDNDLQTLTAGALDFDQNGAGANAIQGGNIIDLGDGTNDSSLLASNSTDTQVLTGTTFDMDQITVTSAIQAGNAITVATGLGATGQVRAAQDADLTGAVTLNQQGTTTSKQHINFAGIKP